LQGNGEGRLTFQNVAPNRSRREPRHRVGEELLRKHLVDDRTARVTQVAERQVVVLGVRVEEPRKSDDGYGFPSAFSHSSCSQCSTEENFCHNEGRARLASLSHFGCCETQVGGNCQKYGQKFNFTWNNIQQHWIQQHTHKKTNK
jgi:hypothetical protein